MNPAIVSMVTCPVCNSDETRFALKVKDHSVSGEYFEIYECTRCNLRFTKTHLPGEYQSAAITSRRIIFHTAIPGKES